MYEFTYYDEENLLVKENFNNLPTTTEIINVLLDVDVGIQRSSLRDLMKADGEYVSFVGEDEQGYQDALYYARLHLTKEEECL